MDDRYGRKIEYLRLSVTGLCNLRCRYCMPEEGIEKKDHCEMLTEEEMLSAVRAAAGLGIRKVRITGGEPLVKKNIISICQRISTIQGICEVYLTTNGTLLAGKAKALRDAGVMGINLSLDTLDEKTYASVTRGGKLGDALEGLEAAATAGFNRIRVNAVLMGGINDDERSIRELAGLTQKYPLDLRFIELMPMPLGNAERFSYVSAQRVADILNLTGNPETEGVCSYYRQSENCGRIGLITPMSHKFCGGCNRIRITADGRVKPCLHSAVEYNIKGLDEAGMEAVLQKAILAKPRQHGLKVSEVSDAGRYMNTIGG